MASRHGELPSLQHINNNKLDRHIMAAYADSAHLWTSILLQQQGAWHAIHKSGTTASNTSDNRISMTHFVE